MGRYDHLMFVCTNERPESDKRGSCSGRGSTEVVARLKALIEENKLKGRVRAVRCGCLNVCEQGANVLVLSADPEINETWYAKVTAEDADRIFSEHVLEGRRVADLVHGKLTRDPDA